MGFGGGVAVAGSGVSTKGKEGGWVVMRLTVKLTFRPLTSVELVEEEL